MFQHLTDRGLKRPGGSHVNCDKTSSRAFSKPRRRKPRDSRICQPLCREVAPKGLFIYTLFTRTQHNTATPYLSSHTQGGFLSNVRVVLGAWV